jgi:hypothetical protein
MDGNDGPRFRRFAIVLAVCSVLLMLLPYVFITAGPLLMAAAELALFAVLYFVGTLFWARGVCRETADSIRSIDALDERCKKRRQDSINAIIQTYGSVLPRCLTARIRAEQLRQVDAMNERIENNWKLHCDYLRAASDELQNLATALRLPAIESVKLPRAQTVNFSHAPYEAGNQEIYMLFGKEA